ncbi:MAG: HIT family protein [bacterium]
MEKIEETGAKVADCVFCKIAAGEISSRKVHRAEGAVVSFLDANPKAPGHTLVIPVAHHPWFQDMPNQLSDTLFREAKRIAQELKAEYAADFIKLRIDGLDIPHVHIHLIPSKFNPKV